MIATVRFYKMKGSLSSGQYPLFTTGQDLSSHMVHSVSRKITADIHQEIEAPSFTGYEDVNIAEMNGLFYWITSFRQSTITNGSVTFTLDLMAPTSFIRVGSSITGSWHKLPTNVCPYLKCEITNGLMQIDSKTTFDTKLTLPFVIASNDGISGMRGYYVQITGYTTGTHEMEQYSLFIGFDNVTYSFDKTDYIYTDATHRFPTFFELFSDITDYTGLLAENILDISISKRCPYAFARSTRPNPPAGYTWYYLNLTNGPTLTDVVGHSGVVIYKTLGGGQLDEPSTQSGQITLTDLQMKTGSVSLRDWNANTIMDIPTMLKSGSNYRLDYIASEWSDMTGLYFTLKIGDQSITIPEGKLPYLSNTWETYKAYDMANDKEAMHNAISYARYQMETDKITGIANAIVGGVNTGAMTGAIANNPAGAAVGIATSAAGVGISLYEQSRNFALTTQRLNQEQILTEKRAKDQPQTAYNTGYGAIYCYQNELNDLAICISVPQNMSSDYFSAWVGLYGYPAEGISTQTAQAGYYQGMLMNDGTIVGEYFDELNRDFMQGFRFITVS